jgi:hypothetical protein
MTPESLPKATTTNPTTTKISGGRVPGTKPRTAGSGKANGAATTPATSSTPGGYGIFE